MIVRIMLKPLQMLMAHSILNADIDSFIKKRPQKIRGFFHPIVKNVIGKFIKRELIIEPESVIQPKNKNQVPILDPNKQYIFASTHLFDEDISSALATIDRNAYILLGTEDQIKVNPQIFAAWANGTVYVDRRSKKSKNDSLIKMQILIENGKSILIFPEGYLNNSENFLISGIFNGVHKLSSATNTEVVPLSSFNDIDSNKIYVRFGEPIKLYDYDLKSGLELLRDTLATIKYDQMEKYGIPLKREKLKEKEDYRLDFVEQRRKTYLRTYWPSTESLLREIDYYKDKENPLPKELWQTLSKVKVTKENIKIMKPILESLKEYQKYDLYQYVKKKGIKQ